jgi:hypothetical protein
VISLNLKFSKIETVEMSAVRAEVIERAALRNRDIAALIAVSELFLDRLAYNYRSARNAPAEKVR